MSTPSGSPATDRRLAVLLSHLYPSASPLAGGPGAPRANAERHQLMAAAAAELLSASPCAGGGTGGSSGGLYCVFCEIVKGTLPASKVYEDDTCLCILDVKPLSVGHSLVIPKSHFSSLQETPPSVLGAICSKLPLLAKAITEATQCVDAFNVLVNNGEEAGQVIFHTHVHIIPRSKDDGLWSSETYERNFLEDNQDTKNLVSCIKELLSSPEDYSTEGSTVPK